MYDHVVKTEKGSEILTGGRSISYVAGRDGGFAISAHEFGHRTEYAIDGVASIENSFLNRRTSNVPSKDWPGGSNLAHRYEVRSMAGRMPEERSAAVGLTGAMTRQKMGPIITQSNPPGSCDFSDQEVTGPSAKSQKMGLASEML